MIDKLLYFICGKIKSLFSRTEITLTRNTKNNPSASTYECYKEEASGRVYLEATIPGRASLEYKSNTTYDLWTVPSEYRPSTARALTIFGVAMTPLKSRVGPDGVISLTPLGGDVGNTGYIYITGWWTPKN